MHDPDTSWRPDWTYIPGKTERHQEDLFDWLKDNVSVPDGSAWRYGLAFFHDGYYWESHEVLEAIWLNCEPNSTERLLVQALIQWANAGLKLKMDRPKAAERLIVKADTLWADYSQRVGNAPPILSDSDIKAMRDRIIIHK